MNTRLLIALGAGLALAALILVGCQPAIPATPLATEEAVTEAPATEEVVVTEAPATEKPVEPCTVKVGVPTLITGFGAPMGADIMAGAELAAKKINEEGGVLGCQIELVFADVKNSAAEDCALAAQVMDQAGVVFYVPGAFYSPACIDEFGKREPLLMHNSASKDMVDLVARNSPEYRNVFMTCEDELIYGPNAYTIIVDQISGQKGYEFPNKKVALLGGDISYDMLIQQGARKAFEAAGWEVVLDDTYAYGNTEFGAQLAKIRAEKPAVIMGQLTSTDSAVAFMNQFLTNPTNSLIYIQWSPASPEFINLLKEKANGVLWQTSVDILPQNKDFYFPMFEAEFDRLPGTWPPMIWDHFQIWKAAVESCGDFKAFDCINTYVEELDKHPYKGLDGTYGMNPAYHKGRSGNEWIPMPFQQIQDQKNVTIYLGTGAIAGTEFQIPPWIK